MSISAWYNLTRSVRYFDRILIYLLSRWLPRNFYRDACNFSFHANLKVDSERIYYHRNSRSLSKFVEWPGVVETIRNWNVKIPVSLSSDKISRRSDEIKRKCTACGFPTVKWSFVVYRRLNIQWTIEDPLERPGTTRVNDVLSKYQSNREKIEHFQ